MRRRQTTGRYEVADKHLPTLGAALVYGQHVCEQSTNGAVHYVRVIGEPRALYRISRTTDGVIVTEPVT